MIRRAYLLALVPLSVLPLGCAGREDVVAAAVADPPVAPTECRRVNGPMKLDGILDEVSWDRAQTISDFRVHWQKRAAKTATTAKLLWSNDYLYFGAEMEDNDLFAKVTEHNGMTWYDDVFELFFKPKKEQLTYYEFQVNAANTQLELFMPSRGAGGYHRFASTSKLGIESAVRLRGTLNQWEDKDKGWTVEGRIPWTAFQVSGGRPKPGDVWRFALCRYDYSATMENPDLSSSAPLSQANFHHYEDYGELKFVGLE